jgi:ribosomal protein S18 acetylase RimI-like enzyme
MASFSSKSASEFSVPQIADLLTRGFEGYLVPIQITEPVLLTMMRRDGIDLVESRVFHEDGDPVGVGLVARRGWTSRLAAMGIVSQARSVGLGTWAMQHLVEDARLRGDREMLLEVIEQNKAGVKLYKKTGFKTVRRLIGYKLEYPQIESKEELQEIDIRELARQVVCDGLPDLPWQLSGITLAHHTPPSRAFFLNDAYCLISNPEAVHVSIASVLIKNDSRKAGAGPDLMRALFASFPGKIWHVSPIYPEEMGFIFEQAGMLQEAISQWQMALSL